MNNEAHAPVGSYKLQTVEQASKSLHLPARMLRRFIREGLLTVYRKQGDGPILISLYQAQQVLESKS